jgi:uncharacterized protein
LGLLPRQRFVLHLCALFAAFLLGPCASAGQGERVQLTVMGDSLADGVWAGLSRNLRADKSFSIRRASRVSSGLAAYDWHAQATKLLDDPTDIVVIMLGANDGQAIRRRGEPRIGYRAERWRDEYADKVHELLNLFAERNIYAVWVGLPIMRTDSMRDQALLLNRIFAATVSGRAGVHYLPTWELTTDDQGEYVAYAELDETGRQQQFRAQDGVHFTMRGYQFLARRVQEIIEAEYLEKRRANKRPEESLGALD